jgi:hypothetical protein
MPEHGHPRRRPTFPHDSHRRHVPLGQPRRLLTQALRDEPLAFRQSRPVLTTRPTTGLRREPVVPRSGGVVGCGVVGAQRVAGRSLAAVACGSAVPTGVTRPRSATLALVLGLPQHPRPRGRFIGLEAHRAETGLPSLRSPESPCPGQPNLRPGPDSSSPSVTFMARLPEATAVLRDTPACRRGCCTNPRRGHWIACKGGLRNRPSHPSSDAGLSRHRRTQPL